MVSQILLYSVVLGHLNNVQFYIKWMLLKYVFSRYLCWLNILPMVWCIFRRIVPGVMLTHLDNTPHPVPWWCLNSSHTQAHSPLVFTHKLLNAVLYCSEWHHCKSTSSFALFPPLPPSPPGPWGQPGESDLPPTSGHHGQLPPWQWLLRAPHHYRYVKETLKLWKLIEWLVFQR